MLGTLGQALCGGGSSVDAASSSRSTPADAGSDEPEHLDPRAPVLFSPHRTFSSKDAFFSACKAALLAEYGYTTHQFSTNASTATAICAARRHAVHCQMQVGVARGHDGRWAIDPLKCSWAHAHGRDEDELRAQAEEAGRKKGKARDEGSGTERDGPSVGTSRSGAREATDEEDTDGSDETDGSEDLSDEKSSADEGRRSSGRAGRAGGSEEEEESEEETNGPTSTAVAQLPMPNLPAVGATFASAAAFEAACVLAVIRIYGYSVSKRSPTSTYSRVQCNYRSGSKSHRCPFALVARKDLVTGRWVVRDTAGPRLHNHGRNPKLVRDSMWVPTVVCETARAALGLPPGKRARDKARRAKEKKRAKAEAKKERLRGKKRKRDDEADADTLMPPPHRPFHSKLSLPHTGSTSTPRSPFLADVVALLSGLDHSLQHVALLLLAAGISTEADLAMWRQVVPGYRAAMYDEMRRKGWALSGEEEERLERGMRGL